MIVDRMMDFLDSLKSSNPNVAGKVKFVLME